MTYRTRPTDPDYRRQPKTTHYCVMCQRDMTLNAPKFWIACELDKLSEIIHPADLVTAQSEIVARRPEYSHPLDLVQFERIGTECARKLGREWYMDEVEHAAAIVALTPNA